MARTPSRNEAAHERIVDVTSRAIRGYGGAGVANVMNAAGLTHSCFSAHFGSCETMLAEAAVRANAGTVAAPGCVAAASPPDAGLPRTDLSDSRLQRTGTSCPIAGPRSETPRQSPEVLHAATRRIKDLIGLVARQSPAWGPSGARGRSLATVATMPGAVLLAFPVEDPHLSEAVRGAALKHLSPAGPA